jgi:hypothetical protein
MMSLFIICNIEQTGHQYLKQIGVGEFLIKRSSTFGLIIEKKVINLRLEVRVGVRIRVRIRIRAQYRVRIRISVWIRVIVIVIVIDNGITTPTDC